MHNKRSKRPPRVEVHSASAKYIKAGHPWITEDSYTKKFPKKSYLVATDRFGNEFASLLHDFDHKNVKARVWSCKKPFFNNENEFYQDLFERLELSISRRLNSNLQNERENYYLVFGEADNLPGLQILALKDRLFLIYYAYYWNKFEKKLVTFLKSILKDQFKEIISQQRNKNKKNERSVLYKAEGVEPKFISNEFGINYEINTKDFYDLGIYTDMSSIRKSLQKEISGSKSFLNLYSYTGAYSLYALANGVKDVHSVDLSKKYLDWLDRNLELNPQLDANLHTRVESNVQNALENYLAEQKTFDFILCDPPTFSSDGKGQSKAIKSYESLIPILDKLLCKNGHVAIFLNTHQTTRSQFEKKIANILHNNKLTSKWKTVRSLKLGEDTLTKKGFPEGDYLKGILFKKIK